MALQYNPPEILDNTDVDTIHARMMSVIPNHVDKSEGGFAYDFTRPAAIEKADAMERLNAVIQLFFPEWSSGDFLTLLAKYDNLNRKQPTAAEADLAVTGTQGAVIPSGTRFSTASTPSMAAVEFATQQDYTIPSSGTLTVHVVCTQRGTVGNVPQNSITLMVAPVSYIASVTNPSPASGGTELESDESLRQRVMDVDRNSELSYVGNESDYKRWAREVDGVGSVIVIPEWQGAGTGTVKLIVMDANGDPANQTILNNVYNHIMQPDSPDTRLANTDVILTVVTATALSVSVSATVQIEDGEVMENVVNKFKSRLLRYFESAKEEGVIRYSRVGSELSQTSGVVDYTSLLVNSDTDNIEVAIDKYPTIGTVTFQEPQEEGDGNE